MIKRERKDEKVKEEKLKKKGKWERKKQIKRERGRKV